MASRKKDKVLMIRVSPEEKDLLESVAEANDLKLSTWVRVVALQAARQEAERSRPRKRSSRDE